MGIALAFSSPLDNNDSMPPFTGRMLGHDSTPAPTTPTPTTQAPTISSAPTMTPAPTVAPLVADDTTIRTAVREWFSDAAAAEAKYGHISRWQTGGVKDMSNLFCNYCGRTWFYFNEDISAWDTSGVTTMKSMFYTQPWFNQPIGKWQTGAVKDMSGMFEEAWRFNQDLGGWDIGAVTKMGDIFEDAWAFDQDLGWCVAHECGLVEAFHGSGCKSTLCGVVQKDVIGNCDPWARPCLIRTKTQCIINSPTLAFLLANILLALLASAEWYVHRRKEEDETYVAATRRLLCCRRCRNEMDFPAESPRDEPDEEATAEKTEVEESVEPSSFSKLTSFLFGEREEAPTEEAPKEEEEAATLPVFAEAEEEAPTEKPPPPPARRWFSSAEPEPAAPRAEDMHQRMAGWYNDAPEAAALRAAWGEYPGTPGALQAWPGFVQVTNAFLDAKLDEA